jgi:hypothetical protein
VKELHLKKAESKIKMLEKKISGGEKGKVFIQQLIRQMSEPQASPRVRPSW